MTRISAARFLLTMQKGGVGVANTAVPTHDGTAPVIGTEIAGTAGTWTGSPVLTYQWQRNTGSWGDIGGATSIDYTPVDADFGYTLRIKEIPNGVTASAAYSAATGTVATNLAAPLAYWPLEEASGTRVDAAGANDLTDNNTVTQAAGVQGNAASFASANSERLSITDNTDLSAGDVAFTIGMWVQLTTLQNTGLFCKWDSGSSNAEYALIYNAAQYAPNNNFTFLVSTTGSNNFRAHATTFGTPSVDTWYFVLAWHDPTGDTINISVNNGTANSTAHAVGVRDGTSALTIGTLTGTIWPLNGRVDEAFFFKRLLTDYEKAWLYNAGAGRAFAEVATAFLI